MRTVSYPSVPLVLFALLCPVGGNAQSGPYDPARHVTEKSIEEVHAMFKEALAPAQSPISRADARRLMVSSALSALAQKCDLPWPTVYLPTMAYFRHSRKLDERVMTMLGIVHGMEQKLILNRLGEGPCPSAVRDQLSRAMSGRK